ncbi:MAG: hypothetical protein HYY81_06055 [Deltaproteobacteria bacterium]|nr:hypothetical protein [Deltaproteobacteria bacterium]
MKDTPAKIEAKFRKMLLERSGAERIKMGCSMHAAAQALVRASLLQKHASTSPATLRKSLFLRFYGQDFTASRRKRILLALEKA